MKKTSLILASIFALIIVFVWQTIVNDSQNNATEDNKITHTTSDDDFDIVGVIAEVNKEDEKVLLDLSKWLQKDEDQLWIAVGDNTKISKGNEDNIGFDNLNPSSEIKANLENVCFDTIPRFCYAEEIIIK